MSEVAAAPVVDEEDTPDQDFDSGFTPAAPDANTPTETPSEEAPAADEGGEPPAPVETPPAPKLAEITEDQFQDLLTKASKVDELQSKIDQSFGRFGQKIKDISDQLTARTEGGAKIEVTDDDVADLTTEFPEMGGLVRKALEKIVSKIPGASVAPPAATAVDPSQFDKVRTDAVSQAKFEITAETLDATHEGWGEVVGLPDANGAIPDTPYRQWLAKQAEPYRNRVNNSFSAVVIGKSIDDFREATRAAAKQAADRKKRIEASTVPTGTGGHGGGASTSEDDEFNSGFRT